MVSVSGFTLSVGKVICLRVTEFRFRTDIHFSHHQVWGSPIIIYNGYRSLFSCGEVQTEREADHSPQSGVEV